MKLTLNSSNQSIRLHMMAGIVVVLVLGVGVGGWAATAELSGAVITEGTVEVDSHVKTVQHPTGGVVGKVNVRDGDRVKAGDVLVQLDGTATRANLAIITRGIDELTARKARLEAERDGLDSIVFPPELLARISDPTVANAVQNERRLFDLRRTSRLGQKAQLEQRIAQLKDEITGLAAQQSAKSKEIDLIGQELQGVHDLYRQNLVPLSKQTALERDAARLDGERGQLVAAVAQAKGKIIETRLQIIQIDQDLASEVAKDLRDVDAKMDELVERRVTAEDQLNRLDIRAPQDGIVLESKVHTVGGVVTAGEPIMLIVPESDPLMVEAKVNPRDIDRLHVGQTALLRFTSFDVRTTPEIDGTVTEISADTTTDQRTGESYYTVRIAMAPDQLKRLSAVKLIPGMPVEAFVQTDKRTVISYLTKPLRDQVMRAFRE
jgi:HlyD family secretion protein